MHTQGFKAAPFFVFILLFSLVFAGQPANANLGELETIHGKHSLEISESGIYIIQLDDASLATYQGSIPGLKATSPEATGARRLDTRSPESQNYLKYLTRKHNELRSNLEKTFNRKVEVVFDYRNTLNAMAIRLSYKEALLAFNLPNVKTIYPDKIYQLDTDVGPALIGAPAIWNGETLDDIATKGEGIIIGVIDSGINHAHPSFADIGDDLYDHTNPYDPDTYVGVCATDPAYSEFCNDKLIGAYDLTVPGSGGPEDEDGHGSHTASTAGGNVVDVQIDDGTGGVFDVQISGVAPHANLIAYRVCDDDGGCQGAATIAAVDHAIEDGVHVLNYSISGSDDPWNDPVDIAFLDAFAAGIFVSASAGNAGPDASTVAKTGPWNAAVAASTHSRIIANPIDVVTEDTNDIDLFDIPGLQGNGLPLTSNFTQSILWGGDIDATNIEGCNAWPVNSFAGKIGMVKRGTCAFEIKINNLFAAGAQAALLYNNVGGPPIAMDVATATAIPSMMISLADGEAVVALIGGSKPANATMYAALDFIYYDPWADIMAGFSSRGPSQWELLKPDYTAPGVNILAAVAAVEGDPVQFDFYQGTSMASPHGAGSAALLVDLHPDWSPAAVKSAIALSANQNVLDSDGATPADPFDMGSGRIDLAKAANIGFVLEETTANYIAANPYSGGEPNTLNQPSMVEYTCIGTCTWTRTIQSTLDAAQEWQISFNVPSGIQLEATPMNFTLAAGASQTIEITADLSSGVVDTFYFADVILTPVGNPGISTGHLPVVTKLGASSLPGYMKIETDELSGVVTLDDLQAFYEITDLHTVVSGMVEGTYLDIPLAQDPTNTDPFDDLDQVFVVNFLVPKGAMRLVAEIAESEAPDVDLFLGSGRTPSSDTVLCTSATSVWAEYCNIDFPTQGWYWILVQNWQGSQDQPDSIRAVTAIVGNTDVGNLTVTGPDSVTIMEPFDLNVNWNEPSLELGDRWYAQFSVGTDTANEGNLGYTNLDLAFVETVVPDEFIILLPFVVK